MFLASPAGRSPGTVAKAGHKPRSLPRILGEGPRRQDPGLPPSKRKKAVQEAFQGPPPQKLNRSPASKQPSRPDGVHLHRRQLAFSFSAFKAFFIARPGEFLIHKFYLLIADGLKAESSAQERKPRNGTTKKGGGSSPQTGPRLQMRKRPRRPRPSAASSSSRRIPFIAPAGKTKIQRPGNKRPASVSGRLLSFAKGHRGTAFPSSLDPPANRGRFASIEPPFPGRSKQKPLSASTTRPMGPPAWPFSRLAMVPSSSPPGSIPWTQNPSSPFGPPRHGKRAETNRLSGPLSTLPRLYSLFLKL